MFEQFFSACKNERSTEEMIVCRISQNTNFHHSSYLKRKPEKMIILLDHMEISYNHDYKCIILSHQIHLDANTSI